MAYQLTHGNHQHGDPNTTPNRYFLSPTQIVTGLKQIKSTDFGGSTLNLFLQWQGLNIAPIDSFALAVQLTDDSNTTVSTQQITAVPEGENGVFFFQDIYIPNSYLNTWKVSMYILYTDSVTYPTVFTSFKGSSFVTVTPMIVTPEASVEGHEINLGVQYSLNDIITTYEYLPFVNELNTYSTTTAQVGKIYIHFDPMVQPVRQGPWIEPVKKILNMWEKYTLYSCIGYNELTPSYSFNVTYPNPSQLQIQSNFYTIHNSGDFPMPIEQSCAFYDTNPNSYSPQNTTFLFSRFPTINATASPVVVNICGIWFDNAAAFVAIDVAGRDPAAYESVDAWCTHPEELGINHHHLLFPVLLNYKIDTQVRVVGFALDGFPIVGPYLERKDGEWSLWYTADLDECHGIQKSITFDFYGQTLTYPYYYVCTPDFPYWISAFRGTAITLPP